MAMTVRNESAAPTMDRKMKRISIAKMAFSDDAIVSGGRQAGPEMGSHLIEFYGFKPFTSARLARNSEMQACKLLFRLVQNKYHYVLVCLEGDGSSPQLRIHS
jgi:hypothetical protein